MHTIETEKFRFHFDGDFSGDILFGVDIDAKNDRGELVIERNENPSSYLKPDYTVRIPFQDLKTLFVEFLRQKTIGNLENMTDDEFLAWFTIGSEE